ncbi:dienelactone hydrolase family protein [Chryseolinea sp. T2]|uniref:alpha/beta hydrolase n=1 Tax=Chryseolinea sp. T2 TaxID=3129255 RepID=UPI00307691A4
MHQKKIVRAGQPLDKATKALVMLHGRGGTAEDILGLAREFNLKDFALIAPQATNYTWYPFSFMAPVKQNEPWITSAVQIVDETVEEIRKAGIKDENIYFMGFSQGACLTLEYTTRNARRWGGVAAFTGGLIGDRIYSENYRGDFNGTPVFIGTSDPDPHVPVSRVNESTGIIREMKGVVTEKVYPGMGHTINRDEIQIVNKILFS